MPPERAWSALYAARCCALAVVALSSRNTGSGSARPIRPAPAHGQQQPHYTVRQLAKACSQQGFVRRADGNVALVWVASCQAQTQRTCPASRDPTSQQLVHPGAPVGFHA